MKLARLKSRWEADDILPKEDIPYGDKTKEPLNYGIQTWTEMFNPRQLLAHGHCVEAFQECLKQEHVNEVLDERRKAAWAYVGIAIDKLLNRNSVLTRWDAGKNKVASTFDNHDFGFKSSYAEMAVACQGLGLEWSLTQVESCLSDLLVMTNQQQNNASLLEDDKPEKVLAEAF